MTQPNSPGNPDGGPEREAVRIEPSGCVWTIVLDRPARRNAIDRTTAAALYAAFAAFDADAEARVAVLFGAGGTFSAGADLKAISEGRANRIAADGSGPLGPTRMRLGKPVIAAIAGHAVAGGLELALWCDLRVAEEGAVFGVFCRRWGVPLIDGGTVRLPQIVGLGRAMDLTLTGRPVGAAEALAMGLVTRVVPSGTARAEAEALAHTLAAFPATCLRNDRASLLDGLALGPEAALARELEYGVRTLASGEAVAGAARFASGTGRHGPRE